MFDRRGRLQSGRLPFIAKAPAENWYQGCDVFRSLGMMDADNFDAREISTLIDVQLEKTSAVEAGAVMPPDLSCAVRLVQGEELT